MTQIRYPLSPRQVDILRWLAKGMSEMEVCEELKLSYRSVNSHSYRIQAALNAHCIVVLCLKALLFRIVSIDELPVISTVQHSTLSEAQLELLNHIAIGGPLKSFALKKHLSLKECERQRDDICAHLGLESRRRIQLAHYALQQGLLSLTDIQNLYPEDMIQCPDCSGSGKYGCEIRPPSALRSH